MSCAEVYTLLIKKASFSDKLNVIFCISIHFSTIIDIQTHHKKH